MSALARELIQLRTGRTARRGGHRPPPAPRIKEPTYIDDRPADALGRAVPGHWEGDLVIGKGGKPPSRPWSSGPPGSWSSSRCTAATH